MTPRDMHEPHRAATPLELLFDLVPVIAIAATAAGLILLAPPLLALEGVALMTAISVWVRSRLATTR